MTAGPLIVTRPSGDAEALVQTLMVRGIEAVAAPLITIEYRRDAEIPDSVFQAILLTSANGCRALARLRSPPPGLRDVLTIAVGEASTQAALDAGQSNVVTSGGDVDALITTAMDLCEPGDGPLLYISGKQSTGDLQGKLTKQDFTVERVIAYEAVAANKLPAFVRDIVSGQNAAGVILYSPRTAKIWCKLLGDAGLAERGADLVHYCLSNNVAAVIRKAFGDDGAIVTARKPSERAMIAAILEAK